MKRVRQLFVEMVSCMPSKLDSACVARIRSYRAFCQIPKISKQILHRETMAKRAQRASVNVRRISNLQASEIFGICDIRILKVREGKVKSAEILFWPE